MTHASFDFEAYSEAGYVWTPEVNKWKGPYGASAGKKGLPVIGAARYSEDPSTEILVLNYDLKDGQGMREWYPGWPAPQDLFAHLAAGRTLEAHNLGFERWVWLNVAHKRMGWPDLEQYANQLRCSMAKGRASAYPPSLDQATIAAGVSQKKDPQGKTLMKKYSMPVDPTKSNGMRKRWTYADNPEEYLSYTRGYGAQDVRAEMAFSDAVPELTPIELEHYQHDQAINRRGVHVDMRGVQAAIKIIEQAFAKYDQEMQRLTGGIKSSELQQLKGWCAAKGYHLTAMDEDAISEALADPIVPPEVHRVLTLRAHIGSSSVKKVFAIANQVAIGDRLYDLFTFHGARTGRPTGNGPQPTNLPKAGPNIWKCECGRHYHHARNDCPWCGSSIRVDHKGVPFAPGFKTKSLEWNPEAAADAFDIVYLANLELLEHFFGEAMLTLAGCMRGMFDAAPGKTLVSSDFTAIEAVVLACMAGEQWRIDLFRNKGKIYETSASKITGVSVEEMKAYAAAHGANHPHRQIGKTAELGLGYQGWLGAWKAFDDSGKRTDQEIKDIILAWRDASPSIVEFWGGQKRRIPHSREWRDELFGVEGHFIWAAQNPGQTSAPYRGLTFSSEEYTINERAALRVFINLPSGRRLTYHDVTLWASDKWGSNVGITYWGYNTNTKNGPPGWIAIDTWGGRLVENIIQAIANDVLRFSIDTLERNGYPVVMQIYDELVSEIAKGAGSVELFEKLMSILPHWAKCDDGQPWPIFVAGGWMGQRYRKG